MYLFECGNYSENLLENYQRNKCFSYVSSKAVLVSFIECVNFDQIFKDILFCKLGKGISFY